MFSLYIFKQLEGMEISLHFTNSTTTPISSFTPKVGTLKTLCGMKPKRQRLNTSKVPLSI